MRKRLFSILLALCMVLCLVPTTAFAEGETEETQLYAPAETACTAEAINAECPVYGTEGALAENCGKYAAEESGQAGTSNGGDRVLFSRYRLRLRIPTASAAAASQRATIPAIPAADLSAVGTLESVSHIPTIPPVYLTENATLSFGHLTVDGKTLYLCLNGKTLASNGTAKIQVKNGGRLVLCDCQGGGTFKGATQSVWGGACIYLYTSTLDMFGGKLTGGKVTGKGGGEDHRSDDQQCIFNMYGGEISGNNSRLRRRHFPEIQCKHAEHNRRQFQYVRQRYQEQHSQEWRRVLLHHRRDHRYDRRYNFRQ